MSTPIRVPTGTSSLTVGQSYNGQLYILDNLVEVFDRPQLALGSYLPQVP